MCKHKMDKVALMTVLAFCVANNDMISLTLFGYVNWNGIVTRATQISFFSERACFTPSRTTISLGDFVLLCKNNSYLNA